MLLIPYLFSKKVKEKNNHVSSQLSSFTKKTKDIFSGFEVIRSYGVMDNFTTDFQEENRQLEELRYKQSHLEAIIQGVSEYFFIISQLSGTAIAAFFLLKGELSVGSLVAVGQLGNGVFVPIRTVTAHFTSIKGMKGINEKIMELIISNHKFSGHIVPGFQNNIHLQSVSFTYDNEKQILNDVHFTFVKNKKYTIVGESGCGKSTLLKLIAGYFSDYRGLIQIDNHEISEMDTASIATLLSLIHQNVYLFDKCLRYNIHLGAKFSTCAIERSVRLSGIDKFLHTLEDGLHTAVGENGTNLSGGQRQRVAIARAFVRESPIILLDEGTSDLDAQTTYDVEKSLVSIPNLTVIAVTHKLNKDILKKYDEILFMEKGRIVESGSFCELMRRKGEFYKFYSFDRVEKAGAGI